MILSFVRGRPSEMLNGMNASTQPVTTYFLYAEDDPDDQEFFRSMIKDIDPNLEVATVSNGYELIEYLGKIDSDSGLPCCIVLDINMPVWDGIRALKALKLEHRYQHIPVVMFTTSRSLRDNDLCLMLGAKAFFTKPVKLDEFKHLSKRFTVMCGNDVNDKTLL